MIIIMNLGKVSHNIIEKIKAPCAYTNTSVATLDAVKAVSIPTVEVHVSKVEEHEDFRQISYVRPVCVRTIIGNGTDGYLETIDYLIEDK